MRRAAWCFVPLLCACGGLFGGGDSGADAGRDDAGYTTCTTPEGFAICGTTVPACSSSGSCGQCVPANDVPVGVCGSTYVSLPQRSCDDWCDQGEVCLDWIWDGAYWCAPFSLGVLLERHAAGHEEIARYGDLSAWTGDAIPEPATCPSVTGSQLCGGACAACAADNICAGRSPLHPWGVCVPDQPPSDQYHEPGDGGFGPTTCSPDGGNAVFTFTVDPASQPVADRYGRCMPVAMCQALAANLPGGGRCTLP